MAEIPIQPRCEPHRPTGRSRSSADREPVPPTDANVRWGTGLRTTFVLSPEDAASGVFPGDDGEPTFDLDGDARPPSAGDGAPSAETAGRYIVECEIARGGVGAILQAWDTQLKRPVAIKVLLEEHKTKPRVVRRFLEEARITSRLQHPGVVPIHELGISPDGRPFFAMRLVCGQTLEQVLQRRDDSAADLPRLLTIFLQVCQTIAYAHSQEVIHRDLKPANVMVGSYGVVNVMDWGLAKVLGEPDLPDAVAAAREAAELSARVGDRRPSPADAILPGTQVGTVFGTPAYLPPEQARGEIDRLDKRADVFGLGSLLCEILTGKPPYTGADGRAIYDKAVDVDLDDAIGRLNACLAPLDIVTLAKWCLSPIPSDRPPHAGDVVEVMNAYMQASQRRAEQDLVRFFDLSLDLFCIAGTEGYFHRVNENFPKLLGYTAEDLTSRPFIDFVHPDDRGKTGEQLTHLAYGEPCVQFVNRYRHADGHYLWLEWNAQTVPEERSIYAVARDVTKRVAQEEALRQAEQLRHDVAAFTAPAHVAIISTTLDGTIENWNAGAEAIYGYSAEEIVGQSILRLVPGDRRHEQEEILARVRGGDRIDRFETLRVDKFGRLLAVAITISPIRDFFGRVIGASAVVCGKPGRL